MLKIEESLYFANVEQIKDMLKRIQEFGSHLAHPTDKKENVPLQAIVLHCKNIAAMDARYTCYFFFIVCFFKLSSKLINF